MMSVGVVVVVVVVVLKAGTKIRHQIQQQQTLKMVAKLQESCQFPVRSSRSVIENKSLLEKSPPLIQIWDRSLPLSIKREK